MQRPSCPECGAPCEASHRFCAACGHPLRNTPPRSAAPEPSDWGEVKAATILFADIADSTRQIAELSPEQAMQQLQPAIASMVRVVDQHGGTVLRTLGDGIMALFGVPLALEDHASRACLAAMRMQQLFAETEADGVPALALRVGLHTGKVASDPTEAGDRRGGGAHGVAIHLASRVAALAEPGQVLLTEDTRHLLRSGVMGVRPLGNWHLKGIVHPVALFALRFDVARAALLEPSRPPGDFVGRTHELAQLAHAFGRTRAGQGQVVGISGDAGSGKTRLCQEFARQCGRDGAEVVWTQAHPLSHALPLRPVRELLGALCFGMSAGHLAPTAARRHIDAALARAGVTDAADARLMHELMGLGEDAPAAAALAPQGRQARLLGLVAALVRAGGGQLRVVVVEDLHWLDAASWPFLNVLAESVATTHTLLLTNQRRDMAFAWPRLTHAACLTLGALPQQALRVIVAQRLGKASGQPAADADSERWIDRIIERSQGNPFFAEELVRHLRRAGTESARWQAELPDSIDSLIAARIDTLPDTDKRVLQVCAVIGKEIDAAVLARVLGLPPGRSAAALRRLQAMELLTRADAAQLAGAGASAGLRFFHPLIQEVAYGAQLHTRRRELHARVAAVMARRYAAGPRAGELAALLAHHHEQAGELLPAARQATLAAHWLRSSDVNHAIASWRKVLQLAAPLAPDQEALAMSALAAGRIVFLGWRGGVSTQEGDVLVAQALAHAGQADARLPQLLQVAHARMRQAAGGPADDYVSAVQAALAMPDPPGNAGRRALLHVVLCQACAWAGRLPEALAAADVAVAGGRAIDPFDRDFVGFSVLQWAVGLRMRVLLRMGRVAEAAANFDELAQLSREEPDVVMRGIAHNLRLELRRIQGRGSLRSDSALAEFQENAHSDYVRVTAAYFLAVDSMGEHQFAKACAQLQDGLGHLRDTRVAVDFEVELLSLLAEALAARGHWPAAERTAHEALALAVARTHRVCECRAALVLARAALASSPPHEADAWLRRADELLALTGAALWRPMWRSLMARRRRSALGTS